MPISLIIADDHPVVRQGLRQAIESDAEMRVLAEAGDGQQALELIEIHQPDIVIFDIDMPAMDGFAAARILRDKNLAVVIVFLTIHDDEDIFNEAVDLGAKGYVLKDSALGDIVGCLKTVAAGSFYVSPSLTNHLINRSRSFLNSQKEKPGIKDLTQAESRVLKLIAEYKTSREIAEELFISPRTVETHRTNIAQKLDLRGNHALIKFALAHKSQLP